VNLATPTGCPPRFLLDEAWESASEEKLLCIKTRILIRERESENMSHTRNPNRTLTVVFLAFPRLANRFGDTLIVFLSHCLAFLLGFCPSSATASRLYASRRFGLATGETSGESLSTERTSVRQVPSPWHRRPRRHPRRHPCRVPNCLGNPSTLPPTPLLGGSLGAQFPRRIRPTYKWRSLPLCSLSLPFS
jgi:hypothetical protein